MRLVTLYSWCWQAREFPYSTCQSLRESVLFFLLKEAHFIPPRYGLAARCASRGHEDLPELLSHRRQHHDIGGGKDVRQLVVVVPASQEHVAGSQALDRVERVLALPLAGEATQQDQGGRDREGGLRPAVGADQQAQALHRGETPHVQQHEPLREGAQQVGRVGHRPRLAAGTPPAGALDEELPPQGEALDRTPIEAPRIEAIGQLYIAVRVELQQLLRPRELRRRWHHKPLAAGRPAAHALR